MDRERMKVGIMGGGVGGIEWNVCFMPFTQTPPENMGSIPLRNSE